MRGCMWGVGGGGGGSEKGERCNANERASGISREGEKAREEGAAQWLCGEMTTAVQRDRDAQTVKQPTLAPHTPGPNYRSNRDLLVDGVNTGIKSYVTEEREQSYLKHLGHGERQKTGRGNKGRIGAGGKRKTRGISVAILK